MSSSGGSSRTPLTATLAQRHEYVTQLTGKYCRADIIPPTTNASILSAQKFSVAHHYLVTAVVFIYGFFIPLIVPVLPGKSESERYGTFASHDWKGNRESLVIFGILIAIPLMRLLVASFESAFYQIALMFVSLEAIVFVFVCIWWSPGLPALAVILASNLLNVTVSQIFFGRRLSDMTWHLKQLIPRKSKQSLVDTTVVRVWGGWAETISYEWMKLMGFKLSKTFPQLYDERCGIFTQKSSDMSHAEAMALAYQQATSPFAQIAPWVRSPSEASCVNFFGLFDGLVSIFLSNTVYAFAGLWFGKALFENWTHAGYAAGFAAILVSMYFASLKRTLSWLREGLGVAVAEKEWLAYDVVFHSGEREEVALDVLDTTTETGSSPTAMARRHYKENPHIEVESQADITFFKEGHLNLVHMWLCVASVADFIGETYLSRMFWNMSLETRYMIETMTFFEFRLYHDCKWEVMHKGILVRMAEVMLLAVMSALYFGTFIEEKDFPVRCFALLASMCFVGAMLRLMEAVQFIFTVMANSKDTQRSSYVSEWVLAVVTFFILANVVIWLYMLPIMQHWELPIGHCDNIWNPWVFPAACRGH